MTIRDDEARKSVLKIAWTCVIMAGTLAGITVFFPNSALAQDQSVRQTIVIILTIYFMTGIGFEIIQAEIRQLGALVIGFAYVTNMVSVLLNWLESEPDPEIIKKLTEIIDSLIRVENLDELLDIAALINQLDQPPETEYDGASN